MVTLSATSQQTCLTALKPGTMRITCLHQVRMQPSVVAGERLLKCPTKQIFNLDPVFWHMNRVRMYVCACVYVQALVTIKSSTYLKFRPFIVPHHFQQDLCFVIDRSLPPSPTRPYPHAAHLPHNYGVFPPCVKQSGWSSYVDVPRLLLFSPIKTIHKRNNSTNHPTVNLRTSLWDMKWPSGHNWHVG